MTRKIVVANQKGGVGKTTTVANLGSALTALGHKVLLIDLDPQAALTATFGIDPYRLPVSMYSVLMSDTMPIARALRPTNPSSEMAIAPASVDLAAADVQLARANQRVRRLERALKQNRVPFDFILIDTPPSLGLLTLNGLVGATEVLVPVQAHYLAMRGVRSLMETIWRVKRRLNTQLRLLGLIPTMVEPDSQHATEVINELKSVFKRKVFDIPIHSNVKFAEAPVTNQTLIEAAPNHEGALAYWKLAEEIVSNG